MVNNIGIRSRILNCFNTLRPRQNGRHFPDDIFKFSWMKMYEFRLTFHRSLFLGVQLTIFQHWFRQWLGADQATSHYLNQWWLDYRHKYVSLDLNELRYLDIRKAILHVKSNSEENELGTVMLKVTWCCRKPFSQWQHSFRWKLSCHWLKACDIIIFYR